MVEAVAEAEEEVEEVTVKEALSGMIDIEIPTEGIKKEIEVDTKTIEKAGVVGTMIGENETEDEKGNEIGNTIEREITTKITIEIESTDTGETGIVGKKIFTK